jgi:predicted GNAT family acetyltransferase
MMAELVITKNEAEGRHEAVVDGVTAYSLYEIDGGRMVIRHVEVPESIGGRGIGSALARFALDDARARGLMVVPHCPFVREYVARNRDEYLDLIEPAERGRIGTS